MELEAITNLFAAGSGAAVGYALVVKLLELISGRLTSRETQVAAAQARIDAATTELISHLQSQINSLSAQMDEVVEELSQCRQNHATAQEELSRLRGVVAGLGDARQQAQLIISKEVSSGVD